ncbi:MAG: ABC transporter permease, partial [Sphingobacteriaceae bacterium]|nr:ABC transporter permease [Cytophagaceae bacterium]
VTTGEKTLPADGAFVDPAFFQVFGFRFLAGQPAVAPRTVVLSERAAERFFGPENPLGKQITLKDRGEFTVTGIVETKSQKSHLHFDLLASMASVPLLETSRQLNPHLSDWGSHWNTSAFTYVQLREGTSRRALDGALTSLARQGVKALGPKSDQTYSFRLQALSQISPAREELQNGTWEPTLGGLLAFGALALVILLLAGFNYVNLTLARSLGRAREVGVRKVAGAMRSQLIGQFLTESVLLAVFSLGLAYVLLLALELHPTVLRMTEGIRRDPTLGLYFVGFTLGSGLLAGLVPARVLSGYQPVEVLRGRFGTRLFRGIGLRKGLMVAQFVVSLVFMVFVTVMYRQFLHMATASYGFDRKNSLNVAVSPKNHRIVANELSHLVGVQRVGAMAQPLGFHAEYTRISPDRGQNFAPANAQYVDANYVLNLGLTLVAGQNMPPTGQDSIGRFVLLNEKAVAALRFKTPQDAVGQLLWLEDSSEVRVAGVLKDFNYQNLSRPLNPLVLQYKPNEFHHLNLKIDPHAGASVVPTLERAWKRLYPHDPFT